MRRMRQGDRYAHDRRLLRSSALREEHLHDHTRQRLSMTGLTRGVPGTVAEFLSSVEAGSPDCPSTRNDDPRGLIEYRKVRPTHNQHLAT
jgi:hypothetical protein